MITIRKYRGIEEMEKDSDVLFAAGIGHSCDHDRMEIRVHRELVAQAARLILVTT